MQCYASFSNDHQKKTFSVSSTTGNVSAVDGNCHGVVQDCLCKEPNQNIRSLCSLPLELVVELLNIYYS